MRPRRGTARVAVALLVAVAAACGGDDDGGGASPFGGADDDAAAEAAGDGGSGTGPVFDIDRLCSMLEEPEIEAQFGEVGPVAEGVPDFTHCLWDVGDQVAAVSLSHDEPIPGQTGEQTFAGMRDYIENDSGADTAEASGVGDEAFFELLTEQTVLHFRSGDVAFVLGAYFEPEVAGTEDKLVALAGHVLDRL